jgi:AcrR family transcriptional regulator
MGTTKPSSVPPVGDRPTLGEETRAVVRARIAKGAAAALAAVGFGVTVDEIADAAGVSRRTVFRHFPTHDDLIAAGVAEVFAAYDRLMPELPKSGDLYSWMKQVAVALHELNARVVGKAFWDLRESRPGITPEQARARRFGYAEQVAQSAWRLSNERRPRKTAQRRPPLWVVDAFCLQLSPFATNCMAGYEPQKAAEVSARILCAVLDSALADDPRP